MNTIRRQRGQVLVIIVGTLFLGGTGLATGVLSSGDTLKDMTKNIKALNLADARQDQALDVLKRWKKTLKPVWKAHSKKGDEILDLLEDQYTTEVELRELFAEQADNTADANVQVEGIRDELRAILNKDEWDGVFANK
jgi:glyoxylase-like metal-dependent hydrolase (beta-lactamase superfamily II)